MEEEKSQMLKILESIPSNAPKKRQRNESSLNTNWKKNSSYKPTLLSSDSYVGLDCEMVSTDNDKNALARVSIVNIDGTVLLDTYVKPDEKVVNYRTFVTGIRPRHLNSAKSFEDARKEVKKIIKNKIIVGHAVHHDLKALKLEIDESKLRDTQSLYSKEYGIGSISLQKLCFQTLGRMIQVGHHSSVEDAIATIEVFKTLFLSNKKNKKNRENKDLN